MKYNHHFSNHFGSCRLLAKTHDPHRNRDVEIRMLPGEFEYIGVTDGCDSWIAPVAGDPFSVNIKRLLEDVAAGKPPLIGVNQPRRRAVTPPAAPLPDPLEKPLRRRLSTPLLVLRRR